MGKAGFHRVWSLALCLFKTAVCDVDAVAISSVRSGTYVTIKKFKNKHTKKTQGSCSLVFQWLEVPAPSAGGLGSIPGWGTRSHTLQLRPSAGRQNRRTQVLRVQPSLRCWTAELGAEDVNGLQEL